MSAFCLRFVVQSYHTISSSCLLLFFCFFKLFNIHSPFPVQGTYRLRDVSCASCHTHLGWKYDQSPQAHASQQFKQFSYLFAVSALAVPANAPAAAEPAAAVPNLDFAIDAEVEDIEDDEVDDTLPILIDPVAPNPLGNPPDGLDAPRPFAGMVGPFAVAAPPRFELPQPLQTVARLGPPPELLQPVPAVAATNVWANPAPWMLEALADEEAEDEDAVPLSDEDEDDALGDAAI
jgi:hypothetical protein